MGRDKAWIALDGKPLVRHAYDALDGCCDEVFVVARDPGPFIREALTAVADAPQPTGPVGGILSALRSASHPLVFIAACDMPFLSGTFIRELAALAGGHDAVVPIRDGRRESLHTVWVKDLQVPDPPQSVHELLDVLNVFDVTEDQWRTWDPAGLSLTNLNTPAELEAAARSPRSPI